MNKPHSFFRMLDLGVDELGQASNAIEEITDDKLDMVLVRGAFPAEACALARKNMEERELAWMKLNDGLPSINIDLLGWPSFPTYKAPKGPTTEQHFAADAQYRPVIDAPFPARFNPGAQFEKVLGRLSGDRKLQVPPAPEGKHYLPYTVRAYPAGVGTLSHCDYHFGLPFFAEMVPELDTTTLISFVVVLQKSNQGGELTLYDLKRGRDVEPRLPNGFWDQQAIETHYPRTAIDPGEGDMFVFSAGRCFHKVEPVIGDRRRITLGGLAALNKERTSVWYWG
jgi:hypothetical protein